MAEERDTKAPAEADLALTDKQAADVKGGQALKKKSKKKKASAGPTGGRFQPM